MNIRAIILGSSIVLSALVGTTAEAHHILGIPHYAYDKDYPQTPVLTWTATAGAYAVEMTSYPGEIEPGKPVSLHVYIRRSDSDELYAGGAHMVITRDRLLGHGSVVYGPIEAELDERIYKFHPQLDEEGEYLALLEFEADGRSYEIGFPIAAGQPGSPWSVVGVTAAALALAGIFLRAVRIKRKRQTGRNAAVAHAAVSP